MHQLVSDILLRVLYLRGSILRKPEIDVHVVEVPADTIHLSSG